MYNNDIIITTLNIYITSYMTRSKYMILNRRSLKGNKTRNAKSFFKKTLLYQRTKENRAVSTTH